MRTLIVLVIAGLVGGGAGYLVPVQQPVEAASASAAFADDTAPRRGESARQKVAGILACGAHEDARMAVLLPQSQ